MCMNISVVKFYFCQILIEDNSIHICYVFCCLGLSNYPFCCYFFNDAGLWYSVCLLCTFCRGIDLTQWKEKLQTEAEPANIDKFIRHLSENHFFPNRVLVDCTADTSVASHYYDWLKKGIHVITPNKKANSGPLERVMISLFFKNKCSPLLIFVWVVWFGH